jgi:hypothetical protein
MSIGLAAVLGACSDGSASSDVEPSAPVSTDVGVTGAGTADAVTDRGGTSGAPDASVVEPVAEATAAPTDLDDPTPPTAPPGASSTTFAVVEVPETGIPGIDSEDAFCAAWSRFGGSWQVIQVAANFAPDPSIVPAMEVVAAPVVGAAYDAMFAAWPDELATERDVVADGFFGPLDRRAEAALTALAAAGASEGDLAAIGDAWVDALTARELDDPVLTPDLTDEQWALVDRAATTFDQQLVGFVEDPSMRITVETPLTDAYLATACPDQGALAGGEVEAG